MLGLWITLGIIGALLIIFGIPLLVCESVLKKTYPKRCDGSITIKYPTIDLYKGLNVKKGYFVNNKKARLTTYLYSHELSEYKGVVIFIHGIGNGHTYALTLIDYLASNGYLVYCYDQFACGSSEGKKLDSMYQGNVDIKYALRDVENNPELNKYKLYVIGHSWGGCSAINSTRYSKKIEKVIDVSGMDSEAMMAPKGVGTFVKLRSLLHYGRAGLWTGASSMKKTSAKVLYLQGICDKIVDPRYSGLMYKEMFKNKENIRVEMIINKGHTPFVTRESQEQQDGVMSQFGLQVTTLPKMQERIDYKKISQPNMEIYEMMLDFLDN